MRARGFSLVEFMVAMTIGLFLIAGLVYLIAETSRSRAEIERSSRQIENGRYALDRIAEDLRHAGFFSDYFSVPAAGETGFPATLTAAIAPGGAGTACSGITAANLATRMAPGMPLAIQAYDGGASVPTDLADCIASADYQPGTDILVVRRASTTTLCPAGKTCCAAAPTAPYTTSCVPAVPSGALLANQPYIQTTSSEYKLDIGSNPGTFTLTHPSANTTATIDVPVHRYMVRIYFVAKCNVPSSGVSTDPCDSAADGGNPIPTLKMMELGVNPVTLAGPQFNKLAVAEGIEHLQFDFGIDDTGDGVADRIEMPGTSGCFSGGCAANVATRDWSNVVSAQVSIVARNAETSPNYSDDKTYSLGLLGYTGPPGDHYRRHSYSSLVRLNNVAMRRE